MRRLPQLGALCLSLSLATASAASTVSLYGQTNFERSGSTLDQTARIELSPADGVTTLDLYLHYDPAVVTPTAVYRTGATNAFTLGYYLGTPGAVEIHLSGSTPLGGIADVAWIAFRVIGASGSVAALTWDSAVLNGGSIPSTPQVVKDTLVGTSDVTFSIPDDIQTTQSATLVVNISATSYTFANGIDLRLRYNPAVAVISNVAKTTLTNPFTLTSNQTAPGVLQMQFSGTAEPVGSGPVASLTLNIVGGAGSATPLILDLARTGGNVKFADDGYLAVCPASCEDGSVCTTDACVLGQCAHQAVTTTTVCRAAVGPCDVAEICDPSGNCPPDGGITTTPAGAPLLALGPEPGGSLLSWSSIPSASAYDVVRGSLGTLRASAGNFTSATETCLANDLPGESAHDATRPSSGNAFWYLVRPVNCAGHGTYDEASPPQTGTRDSEIQASPLACP